MILDLQKKINHLLYCYFTAVGVIQRDCYDDEVYNTMDVLIQEIKATRKAIDDHLNETPEERNVNDLDVAKVIEKTEKHLENGRALIDHILKDIQ